MKKSLILVLTLSLLLATTGTVFAAGNGPQHGRADYFTVTGVIDSVGSESIDVIVVGGKTPATSTPQTINVGSSTVYLYNNGEVTVPVTSAFLEVGQKVSVQGVVVDGVWTAYRITVGASVTHYVP